MHPSKTTVLLAEGASAMRQALASQLQTFGFGQVLQARDGTRALQMLRAEPVHVVICDLDMQGMDGLSVLEAMRADPKLAGLPFILMSGGLDRDSAARAIRLGIGALLVKPFTVRRLIERMQRVLQRDAQALVSALAPAPQEPVPEPSATEPDRATILVTMWPADSSMRLANRWWQRRPARPERLRVFRPWSMPALHAKTPRLVESKCSP